MNQQSNRYIGINQRIPFQVLDEGLASLLENGKIEKSALLLHMREFTQGANRAEKAAAYAKAILSRPKESLVYIKDSLSAAAYRALPVRERKALVLALIAITYPIAYDLLAGMARGFKVQPTLSITTVRQLLGKLYGSNRTVAIAIDALIPMLIDLDAIKRSKLALYELAERWESKNPVVSEIWVYADLKSSGEKAIIVEDLENRPWNLYILPLLRTESPILRREASPSGAGYVVAR